MIELYTTARIKHGYRIVSNGPSGNDLWWSLSAEGYEEDHFLGSFSGEIEVEDPAPERRCYFHIRGDHGYAVTAPRSLGLRGITNARDMGMYETADGTAMVRPGIFLRTGRINAPAAGDIEKLTELGIRLVYDLRSDDEKERAKDTPIPGAIMAGKPMNDAMEVTKRQRREHLPFAQFIRMPYEEYHRSGIEETAENYRKVPFGNPALQEFMQLLLEGNAPALFHCSAGKDRTGITQAVILMALGVPDEAIIYDYLLTNEFMASIRNALWLEHSPGHEDPEGLKKILEWLFAIREEYIRSTLDEIDRRYESREEYLLREIGFDAEKTGRFRKLYLIRHQA
ncbi:MAG: tyrosine-protein phosphatase [Oscillospiraceae bacterium]|nr:tyrosine-protein phosphatase [Oscillospiraceae bacterium]